MRVTFFIFLHFLLFEFVQFYILTNNAVLHSLCASSGINIHVLLGIHLSRNNRGKAYAYFQLVFPRNLLEFFLFSGKIISGGSNGKESACNEGDLGLIHGSGRSPRGEHGNPLQYSCLENPHGQRSLASYNSWGHKEMATIEQLSTHWNFFFFP